MGNKIFVVDDSIPVLEGVDDTKAIPVAEIEKALLKSELWQEKTLIGLFESLLIKESENQVTAFTNPAFCLKRIKSGEKPEIIVYDWDYPAGDSRGDLLKIFKACPKSSVIAIYTRYDNQSDVSESIQADDFKKYKNRVQIIRKDEDSSQPSQAVAKIKHLFDSLKKRGRIAKDPKKGRVFTVWYGTNRKPLSQDVLTTGFGSERDTRVHYGKAAISIPFSHKFAHLGSTFLKRFVKGDDDRLKLLSLNPLAESDFWRTLKDSTPNTSDALVFIHGYNVKFNDALIRAAQLGFDLKISGPTAIFSWPSIGELVGYARDCDSTDFSAEYLSDFLVKMLHQSGASRIHLIAHSMGNRSLLHSLRSVVQNLNAKKFGQILLAAPDVDHDVFRQGAVNYSSVCERTTLYVCSKDKALLASSALRDENRVGFGPPILTFQDIDTIDASHLDLTFLGHDYYAAAEALIYDIYDAIRGTPTDSRPRLQGMSAGGQTYWQLRPSA